MPYLKRIYSLAVAALVAIAVTGPVYAQHVNQAETTDQLLICDAIEDSADKLACFNAVVEGVKPRSSLPDTEVSKIPDIPKVAPTTETDSPVPSSVTTAPDVAVAPMPSPAPEPQPVGASTEPPVSPSKEIEDFGRDSMRTETVREEKETEKAEQEALIVNATIERMWPTADGRFSVRLDNGQVWRETEGSRVGKPKEGRSVEISEGRFGGYRMKIDGIRRVAWVRRTR